MPQTESEPTIADVMNVLLEQGRKMPTKQDLKELQAEVLRDTKIEIAKAVDPLKREVYDLKDRVVQLESSSSKPSTSGGIADKQLAELHKLVQECDPAMKRVAFTGWPESMLPDARLQKISEFVATHCSGTRIVDTGSFYSGPYKDRKITKAAFVEFVSSDAAKAVMDKLKNILLKTAGDTTIPTKPARTKINGKRNFSLRRAEELIKADPQASGKEVKINWNDSESGVRTVSVDNSTAFTQSKSDLVGKFSAPFESLALP